MPYWITFLAPFGLMTDWTTWIPFLPVRIMLTKRLPPAPLIRSIVDRVVARAMALLAAVACACGNPRSLTAAARRDRKSTRLNSSHANISYAVFCLKKKKKKYINQKQKYQS